MRDLGKEKIQGIEIFLGGLFGIVVSLWRHLGLLFIVLAFGMSIVGITVFVVAKKDSTKLSDPKVIDDSENTRTLIILIALTILAILLFPLIFH
jgi:hypothetical protein